MAAECILWAPGFNLHRRATEPGFGLVVRLIRSASAAALRDIQRNDSRLAAAAFDTMLDASCLHPGLDECAATAPSSRLALYMHASHQTEALATCGRTCAERSVPKLDNKAHDMCSVLRFLCGAKIILTTSYIRRHFCATPAARTPYAPPSSMDRVVSHVRAIAQVPWHPVGDVHEPDRDCHRRLQ
jgi:hypothetical protein